MTPARLRLLTLLALLLPIGVIAIASSASAAFTALALAAAAATAAMLLAGPVFRTILAVLIALLGVAVILVAANSPEAGGLGVTAVVGGILLVLAAGWATRMVRRWPVSTSRYARSRIAGDRASDWDALSEGDDPTDADR